ncbi:putative type II toxin-antitoxin system HicB family antitoxin [Vibrio phage VPMCC14]|nr:putative type II toxin-antitoxin system HicB family antitoxin [Vibrio phage VPMCC14]
MQLKYKGFTTIIRYSPEDGVFHGKLEGIEDLVTFECEKGNSDVIKAFEETVDDYLITKEEK